MKKNGGRAASEVIEEIVKGNNCYAILGIAVQLILETQETTETTLAIVTCQRLWMHDISRSVQESSEKNNGRKGYGQDVRSLAISFAFSENKDIKKAFKSALARFPDNLPFEWEEQRANVQVATDLKERAEQWSGLGDAENYKQTQHSERPAMISYASPKVLTNEAQKKLEANNVYLKRVENIFLADKSLKDGEFADDFRLDEAITYANSIDNKSLYTGYDQYDPSSLESAITSIAACVICFGDPKSDDYEWAWGIVARAEAMKPSDISWGNNPSVTFHPIKYLIIALQYDRGLEKPRADSAERLLKLTVHPNDHLKELAFEALFADKDDHLRWISCQLAANLCITHQVRPNEGGWDDSANKKAQSNSLTGALHAFKAQETTSMPKLPLAWVKKNIERKQQKQWWDLQNHSNDTSDTQEWIPPNVFFNSQIAAKIFAKMPVEVWMESDVHRPLFEAFLLELVQWTIDIIIPPAGEYMSRYYNAGSLYEWNRVLGDLLARSVPFVSIDFMRSKLLEPFLVDKSEALVVLSSFVEMVVCRHIYDAEKILPNAIALLDDCVKSIVDKETFWSINWQTGEFFYSEMEGLISALLFVHLRENAPDAVRYANGDWSEIDAIMPIIDKVVRHIGCFPSVMHNFLDLCECAGDSYPVSTFAQQVNVALSATNNTYAKWNELLLPPRIAAIVQRQSDWNYPLCYEDAHALLKILDTLIDLGDRRSAALEQTEAFRSIQERPSLG